MIRPLEGGGRCRLPLLRFRSLNLPWRTQPWIPSARPRRHHSPCPAIENEKFQTTNRLKIEQQPLSFSDAETHTSCRACQSLTSDLVHMRACNSVYLGFLDFLLTKLRGFAGLASVGLLLGIHGGSPSYFIVIASRICSCAVVESSYQGPLHSAFVLQFGASVFKTGLRMK
jgi:hypothetical protein